MIKFIEITAIVIIVTIIVLLLTIEYSILKYNYNTKRKYDLDIYKTNMEIDLDVDKTIEFFNNLIENTFNEYIILNLGFREDLDYLPEEMEALITKEVSMDVVDKISPVFMDKLSLIYRYETIPDIITKNVHMYTMNYMIEKNKPK